MGSYYRHESLRSVLLQSRGAFAVPFRYRRLDCKHQQPGGKESTRWRFRVQRIEVWFERNDRSDHARPSPGRCESQLHHAGQCRYGIWRSFGTGEIRVEDCAGGCRGNRVGHFTKAWAYAGEPSGSQARQTTAKMMRKLTTIIDEAERF